MCYIYDNGIGVGLVFFLFSLFTEI